MPESPQGRLCLLHAVAALWAVLVVLNAVLAIRCFVHGWWSGLFNVAAVGLIGSLYLAKLGPEIARVRRVAHAQAAGAARTRIAELEAELGIGGEPSSDSVPAPELTAEELTAFESAFEEAQGQPHVILPEHAHVLRRRTPEQRRAWLLEHRDDAIDRGIPAQLVDMMIAEAEDDDA